MLGRLEPEPNGRRHLMRKWLPLIAVCLGTFMLLIDVTIVNVALPAMAIDLHTTFTSLQWVIDMYALVLAALLLGAGSLSDIVGRRLIYIVGLVVFAAASLASGLAADGTVLIVARGVQGVGAAAMFATTVALLNEAYAGRERGIAYGIWGAVNGAAAAAGPIIGGLLTEHLSWRWIFFVNLPISAVAIALSLAVFSGARSGFRGRIDVPGMVTFTASASLLTYAFIRAGDVGWSATSTLGLIVAGLVALTAFLAVESRSASPLLDLALFGDRRFVGAMIVAFTFSLAAFAYLAYASIWLQSVLGLSPIQAGAVFLPLSLTGFLVSAAIGRRLHGADPRWIIATGMALIGAGAFAQAILGAHSRWPELLGGLFVAGFGVGLVAPTLTSAIMASVPPQRGGMASGAMNTARQLGFALGIAVLGTTFQTRIAHVLGTHRVPGAGQVAAAVSGGQTHAVLAAAPAAFRPVLSGAIDAAFASGLNVILVVSGAIAVAAALAVAILLRPQPAVSVEHKAIRDLGMDRPDSRRIRAKISGPR
jgi:EmrB/QacA subfamily drug resistance transporter